MQVVRTKNGKVPVFVQYKKPDCTIRKTMVGFACQKVSVLVKLPTGDGDIENRLLWACGQELQGYLSSDRCRYFAKYAESIILL